MKKNKTNSFAGAALSLCLKPEELEARLAAYDQLADIKTERDRAIDAATHERQRLQNFANFVEKTFSAIENGGKVNMAEAKKVLQYSRNIKLIQP